MVNKNITLEQIDNLLQKRISESEMRIKKDIVSKDDLKNFATKHDMKSMRSGVKKDMKVMESGIRSDMKTMESGIRKDMKGMESGIRSDMKTMEERLDEKMINNNKDIIDAVESYTSQLPSKEEFYNQTDKLMGEIKDLRDEVTVHNHQVQRNADEIQELKKVVFKN